MGTRELFPISGHGFLETHMSHGLKANSVTLDENLHGTGFMAEAQIWRS